MIAFKMSIFLVAHFPFPVTGLATESDWRQRSGGVQPASVLRATKSDAKTASLVQGMYRLVTVLYRLCIGAYSLTHHERFGPWAIRAVKAHGLKCAESMFRWAHKLLV